MIDNKFELINTEDGLKLIEYELSIKEEKLLNNYDESKESLLKQLKDVSEELDKLHDKELHLESILKAFNVFESKKLSQEDSEEEIVFEDSTEDSTEDE